MIRLESLSESLITEIIRHSNSYFLAWCCCHSKLWLNIINNYFDKGLPYDGMCIWHQRTKFFIRKNRKLKKIVLPITDRSLQHRLVSLSISKRSLYCIRECVVGFNKICTYHIYSKCF